MLNATLRDRQDVTEGLFIFRVEPDAGVPDFVPGQYVALGITAEVPRVNGCPADAKPLRPGQLLKRAYSIGSSPDEKEALEFYIALVPEGVLTPRLATLQAGDRLFVAPKIVGKFTLEKVPPEHSLVLVATGTGIAPYISMLRNPTTWTPGRKITLILGVRYTGDLAYSKELEELAAAHSDFQYFETVSRPEDDWSGERGYVQRFFTEGHVDPDPATDHVFLCGNPAMIEDVTEILTARGYIEHSRKTPGTLHVEKYW